MSRVEKIWARYRAQPWYFQALLFVPFVLALMLGVVWYFWDATGSGGEKLVRAHRKRAERLLDDHKDEDKRLKKLQAKAARRRLEIKRGLEKRYADTEDIIERIDRADSAELERIADELRERAGDAPVADDDPFGSRR